MRLSTEKSVHDILRAFPSGLLVQDHDITAFDPAAKTNRDTVFMIFDGSRYIPLSVLKSKDFIFLENK